MTGLRCSNCGFYNLSARSKCARCGKPLPVIDGESKPEPLLEIQEDNTGAGSLPAAEPVTATGSGSAIVAELISESEDLPEVVPEIPEAQAAKPEAEEFDLAKLTEEEPGLKPKEMSPVPEVPSFDDSAAGKIGTEAELGELSQFFKDAKRKAPGPDTAPPPAKTAPGPEVKPAPQPAAAPASAVKPAPPKVEVKPAPVAAPASKPEVKPAPAPQASAPIPEPKPFVPPPTGKPEEQPAVPPPTGPANPIPVAIKGWPKEPPAAETRPLFKPIPVEDSGESWPEVKAEPGSSGGFSVGEASASRPAAGEGSEASVSQITVKPAESSSASEFNPNFSDQDNRFKQMLSDLDTEVKRRRSQQPGPETSPSDSAVTRPAAAGFLKLILAGTIDLLIYFGIAVSFGLAGKWAGAVSLSGAAPKEIAGFVFPVAVAVLLVVWFYQVFFLSVLGQTPGGMVAGIEVLDKSDHRPGISKAGVRSLVYLLCLVPAGLGFIPTLLGASIPDKFSDTRLVHW